MSISDPKVKLSEPAAPATALTMTAPAPTSALPRSDPEVPYRTITDKELTLVQICCDFVCACIALPLSLVVLAQLSAVPVNAPRQLADEHPDRLAVPGGRGRRARPGRCLSRDPSPAAAERLPRNPRALLRGGRRVRPRPRRRLPLPRPLRHVRALRHAAGHGGHRHHRRHHARPGDPALLPPHADDDAGPGGRRRHHGPPHHAQRAAGPRHDAGRAGRRRPATPSRPTRSAASPNSPSCAGASMCTGSWWRPGTSSPSSRWTSTASCRTSCTSPWCRATTS